MFYTWGCLDAPCLYTPVHSPLLGLKTPPYVPHTPVHLYVLRCFCMLWRVVRGPLHVGHLLTPHPVWGASPCFTPPIQLASLCICMFQGYLHVIWGIFPLCWGFGVFPICWGSWGCQHMECPLLLHVHPCSSLCLTFLLWL